jgi:hypothetical protein
MGDQVLNDDWAFGQVSHFVGDCFGFAEQQRGWIPSH